MITLTSLSKIYRTNEIETVALENVNLKVDRGEFLSIMVMNGGMMITHMSKHIDGNKMDLLRILLIILALINDTTFL